MRENLCPRCHYFLEQSGIYVCLKPALKNKGPVFLEEIEKECPDYQNTWEARRRYKEALAGVAEAYERSFWGQEKLKEEGRQGKW